MVSFYFQSQQNGILYPNAYIISWRIHLLFLYAKPIPGDEQSMLLIPFDPPSNYVLRREKRVSDVETFCLETHFMSLDPFSASRFTMLDNALISQLLGIRASTTYPLLWFRLCRGSGLAWLWSGWRNQAVLCCLITHPVDKRKKNTVKNMNMIMKKWHKHNIRNIA